jgi:plastocyanin
VTRPGRFLFAVAVILAAGCGGSGGASEPVATTEVAMAKSYRFDPGTIEIEAGQTVTWHNQDNFTHTVQVEGREDHEPGTYRCVCRLHRQDMDGEVIVR